MAIKLLIDDPESNATSDILLGSDKSYILGSAASCAVVLPSVSALPEHASIGFAHNRCILENLSPDGETMVNGVAIVRQLLTDRDKIQIGTCTITIRIAGIDADAEADANAQSAESMDDREGIDWLTCGASIVLVVIGGVAFLLAETILFGERLKLVTLVCGALLAALYGIRWLRRQLVGPIVDKAFNAMAIAVATGLILFMIYLLFRNAQVGIRWDGR